MPNRHGTRREIKAAKRREAEFRASLPEGRTYRTLYAAPVHTPLTDPLGPEWIEIGFIEDPPSVLLKEIFTEQGVEFNPMPPVQRQTIDGVEMFPAFTETYGHAQGDNGVYMVTED